MTLNVNVGSWVKRTTAGSDVITGVGFQPTAMLFYTNDCINEAFVEATNNSASFGYSNSTNAASRGIVSDGNYPLSATNTAAGPGSDASVRLFQGGTLTHFYGKPSSYNADGFVFKWIHEAGTWQASLVNFMALGGADLTNVFISGFFAQTGTGNHIISGIGFKPDLVIILNGDNVSKNIAANAGPTAHLSFGIGVMASASGQFSLATVDEDARTTADTWGLSSQLGSAAITQLINSSGAIDAKASFVSFDADGFTINWSDAPATADWMQFMALKGGKYMVGSFRGLVTTGIQGVSFGFQPRGVIFFSEGSVAGTNSTSHANSYLTIATTDGTNFNGMWRGSKDGVADTRLSKFTGSAMRFASPDSTDGTAPIRSAEAVLNGFSASGFTLNWVLANGSLRDVFYIAVGDSDVVSVTTSALPILQTSKFWNPIG